MYLQQLRRSGTTVAWVIVVLSMALAVLILSLELYLPVGLSYSDSYMYLDAAARIQHGQLPHVDFILPVNSLPFSAYYWLQSLFPGAQPILASQFAYLMLTAPAMLATVASSRYPVSAAVAAAAFAAMALLPFNWGDPGFSSGGEVDGFGMYNRASGLALFVLVSAIWLKPPGWTAAVVTAYMLPLLWFTKVTGFALAAALTIPILLDPAFGRWRVVALVGLIVGPVLQATSGTLGAYVESMTWFSGSTGEVSAMAYRLVAEMRNAWWLLVILAGSLAIVLWSERGAIEGLIRIGPKAPIAALRSAVALRSSGFLLLCLGALVVESQNTGSQSYAFIVPALLAIPPSVHSGRLAVMAATMFAAAFLMLTMANAAYRGAKVVVAGAAELSSPALQRFRVSAQPEALQIARSHLEPPFAARAAVSAGFPETLDSVAGEVAYLLSLQNGVSALDSWLVEFGASPGSIASLDFVDPWAHVTGIQAVKGLPVVFDPDRNIPVSKIPQLLERWREADLLLVRRCIEIDRLVEMAGPVLRERDLVSIDPCWDLYVRRDMWKQ